jgi:type II secretory pathway component PulL
MLNSLTSVTTAEHDDLVWFVSKHLRTGGSLAGWFSGEQRERRAEESNWRCMWLS